jgi:hypothetical protein
MERRLWDLRPGGYHLTNITLHAMNAILIGVALEAIGLAAGAWWAAAWFALHPVGVESVAWITERKNTLSLLFYLLAFIAFSKFAQVGCAPVGVSMTRSRLRWYWATLGFFLLALFSKTVVCTLPIA